MFRILNLEMWNPERIPDNVQIAAATREHREIC